MTDLGTYQLMDAVDMFLLDCEARRLTPATRQFYQSKMRRFIRFCAGEGVHALHELTPHHIRNYLISFPRRNLSSWYQHDTARAIRAFLNYCVRDELIAVSPFNKVQMPRLEKKVMEALSPAELHAIFRSCVNARDKALCLFLLDSGVRASELVALNVGDIDLKTGLVKVRLGKGQKDRTTYVGAHTRKEIKRYWATRGDPRPDAPAFASEFRYTRLRLDGLVQAMGRLQERSGVKGCTARAFRRTFAINCLRNGMNVYVLARLMGHADISVLRHYLPLLESDLQDAHERFGTVDHMFK